MTTFYPETPFTQALLGQGLLTPGQLQKHLEASQQHHQPLISVLLEAGINSEALGQVLQEHLGISWVSLETTLVPYALAQLIPEQTAKKHLAIAIAVQGHVLQVATVQVLNPQALAEIEAVSGWQIAPVFANPICIREAIERSYQTPNHPQVLLQALLHLGYGQPPASNPPQPSVLHALLASGTTVAAVLYQQLAEYFGLSYLANTQGLSPDPAYSREESRVLQALPLSNRQVAVWDPSLAQELAAFFPNRDFVLLAPNHWEALWQNHTFTPPLATPISLGQALVQLGFLQTEQAEQLEPEARKQSLSLDRYLKRQRILSSEAIAQGIAAWTGRTYIDPRSDPPDPLVKGQLAKEMVLHYKVLPYRYEEGRLVVLMENPLDLRLVQILQNAAQQEIVPAVSSLEALEAAITQVYERQANIDEIVQAVKARADYGLAQEASEGPAARLMQELIGNAIAQGASDIHLQAPEEGQVHIRYRVDGDLFNAACYPGELHQPMLNFIKVLAGLDIGERRLPQDGRLQWERQGETFDLRIAITPGIGGEKAVIRLLASSRALPTLQDRGFLPETLSRFRQLIHQPYGLILITGPTGSGKTFTSFAALGEIATPYRNVQTIENPVELRLKGIHQLQINPKAGLSFASALRAYLRQDPDVLLVGEIRDPETANLAIEAANTGHLVISSMHTNDAPSAINRLQQLGVEPHNIASALLGVLAQRLVKTVCPHCAQAHTPTDGLATMYREFPELATHSTQSQQGKGCRHCNQSGYRGRTGLFELMPINHNLRAHILGYTTDASLRQLALQEGMVPLRKDGFLKVLQGHTTLEEVRRHTLEQT